MRVLVLNTGSSSLRFQLVETEGRREEPGANRRLAKGRIEGLGGPGVAVLAREGEEAERVRVDGFGVPEAVERVLSWLGRGAAPAVGAVDAVGHRVVHGGERFRDAARIDDEVIEGIRACGELAPLHNPANLAGIEAAAELLGRDVPQVAVFDTAFHATMPESSYLYAVPRELHRRLGIRRYGFHGISHRFVAWRYESRWPVEGRRPDLVTLHLGNGCSACAIREGASVATSMGFTPVSGLVMATRCGDLDPSVVEYLERRDGMSPAEVDELLNRRSGLLALSGSTGDMRELLRRQADDPRAALAVEAFCRRARHYLGAYLAELGGADGVVFTGGIGEGSPEVRRRIAGGLGRLGIELDDARNETAAVGEETEISAAGSAVRVVVVPTDEELLIARDTVRTLRAG